MEIITTRVNKSIVLSEYTDGIRFGTDALLLADFVNGRGKCLDLGAGSGIIGLLLLASRKASVVDGVEIQKQYVSLAAQNALSNGFSGQYNAVERDITHLSEFEADIYDYCVSNPPYLKAGSGFDNLSEALNIARREILCTVDSVCAAASKSVKSGGNVYMVYRADRLDSLLFSLKKHSLQPKRLRVVCPSAEKKPSLVLVDAKKDAAEGMVFENVFYIYKDNLHTEYSDEMKKIYSDFS
ncbi:MAG: methyltransferase [Clostridia bacterium]|nr:methyltransferase [Clostridia bacterium]